MVVKLTAFLILTSMVSLFANKTYSQVKTLNLNMDNASLREVLLKIEDQSGYIFMFSSNVVDVNREVSINARDQKIEAVLYKLFAGTNVDYTIKDRIIVLSLSKIEGEASSQQVRPVSGKITDSSGVSLPGVSIVIKGTTTGTITDSEGKYSLANVPAKATLVFSFVGMRAQEVGVEGKSSINVTMLEETVGLDEVVAIGYGTQKKVAMTGSVSTVNGDELARRPVSNITNALIGEAAGISSMVTSGQPGADNSTIYIRGIGTTGSTSPLIVIDGVIRDDMSQIDPNTIESISILKDASAVAPYGLAGANGVILINTKKGKEGKTTITFDSRYGFQTPTAIGDPLNAVDYMKLMNEAYLDETPGGTDYPYDLTLIENYNELHKQNPDLYPDSRAKDLYDLSAPVQKYNIQVSGGTDNVKYFCSLGYFKQNGLVPKWNYGRYNYDINLQTKVTKTTEFSLLMNNSVSKMNDLDPEESSKRIYNGYYKLFPNEALHYSNGLWGASGSFSLPAIFNSESYLRNTGNIHFTTFTLEQQLPFIKGLSLKGSFSYDTNSSFKKGWHVPWYYYIQDTSTSPYTYTKSTDGLGQTAYTYLTETQSDYKYYTYQGMINYKRTFNNLHEVTGLLVAEAKNSKYYTFSAQRNNYSVLIDELDLGSSSTDDSKNSGSSSEGAQIGYVYRLGYAYNSKYMFEASGRYDGHYYFAPGKRWGYFPAFSLGWRLSEEDFMKKYSFINNLKIRASWGKSGNLAGSAYQYLSGYTLSSNVASFGTGNVVSGAYVDTEANPNITWEVAKKTDIGLEASLWNSLVTMEVDYFHEMRSNMLLSPEVTVPYEYGLDLAEENAGKMKNNGLEMSIGLNYRFANGLKVGLNGNFSYARNKLVEVFETDATYNNPNRRKTGRPLNTMFGYHSLGLFKTSDDINGDGIINGDDGYDIIQFGTLHPGDIKYEDKDGDKEIESDDLTALGNSFPEIVYSFNPSAEWKGFDLSLFFQGTGKCMRNTYDYATVPFLNNKSNGDYYYYHHHWATDNQNAKYPRATTAPTANNSASSDFYNVSGAYLRLKSLNFGYTLPSNRINPLKNMQIRIYFVGENLITFTKMFKSEDPEQYDDSSTDDDENHSRYPLMKTYSLGFNITF